MCCIISWFLGSLIVKTKTDKNICTMFSEIGKVKHNLPITQQLSIYLSDWAKQNYISNFSLSLPILFGGKPRCCGGEKNNTFTFLAIQLFSIAIFSFFLSCRVLGTNIGWCARREAARAAWAFGALRSWINDGGLSLFFCSSAPDAVPSVMVSPGLCCYLISFSFLTFLGMVGEFTQTVTHHVLHCILFLFLSIRLSRWLRGKLK